MASEPPSSFYAVYDGHAGKDAAAYSASQVHEKILASDSYPSNPVAAIKEAFITADNIYLEKGNSEVRIEIFFRNLALARISIFAGKKRGKLLDRVITHYVCGIYGLLQWSG